MCKDYKVIPSEYLGTQHRFLLMDLVFKSYKLKKISVGDARVRWWDLTRGTPLSYRRRLKQKIVGS